MAPYTMKKPTNDHVPEQKVKPHPIITGTSKRDLLKQACRACRSRKKRRDGEFPSCGYCSKISRKTGKPSTCQYFESTHYEESAVNMSRVGDDDSSQASVYI